MVAGSKVETLVTEVVKQKRDLITSMNNSNIAKEKDKALVDELKVKKQLTVQKEEQLQATNQKVKSMAINTVHAFELTEEYNTILFSWYYKGFELLRRYMVKHLHIVNLEELDVEEVDKEMEAAQAVAALEENALKGNNLNLRTLLLMLLMRTRP